MCWIIGSQILKRELAAWRRLSHPNILSLLGTTTDTRPGGIKAMISLWMENGSLDQYMKKNSVLTPSQRLNWVGFSLFSYHLLPIITGERYCWRAEISYVRSPAYP
jgi:serine/threonine protein kinase